MVMNNYRKVIVAVLSLIVILTIFFLKHKKKAPQPQAITKASLVRKSINVFAEGKSRTIGFYRYTPPGYTTGKHPVIIYLHGIGERGYNGTTGTDVTTVSTLLRQPIPKLLPRGSMTF